MRLNVDGVDVVIAAPCTVAAALLNSGSATFRRSVSGEPRAPLCGMGTCFECRVTIDDVPHARACMIDVRDGMIIRTDTHHGGGNAER